MQSNKASLAFYILSSMFGWAGYGVGIAAVSNGSWTRTSITQHGLFRFCVIGQPGNCDYEQESPSLLAVRAFMIMLLPLALTGGITVNTSHWRHSIKYRQAAGVMFFIAGIFGIIGSAVYTAEFQAVVAAGTRYFEVGFILAWVATACELLGALFAFISSQHMDPNYVPPEREKHSCCG